MPNGSSEMLKGEREATHAFSELLHQEIGGTIFGMVHRRPLGSAGRGGQGALISGEPALARPETIRSRAKRMW